MTGLPYSKIFGFGMCTGKEVYKLDNYSVKEFVCRDDSTYYQVLSCGGDPRTCSPIKQNYETLEAAQEEADRLQAKKDTPSPDTPSWMKEKGYKWSKPCNTCNDGDNTNSEEV